MHISCTVRRAAAALTAAGLLLGLAACAPAEQAGDTNDTHDAAGQTAGTSGTYESAGYDSPEAAITAYIEALKAQDFDRMLGTFAIESYVDHFQFADALERTSVYRPSASNPPFPAVSELSRAIDLNARAASIGQSIQYQYTVLCSPYIDLSGQIVFDEAQTAQDFTDTFTKQLEEADFSSIEQVEVLAPETLSENYTAENNQANLARQAACYGADEIKSCALLFQWNNASYLLCMDTYRYGDKWYNGTFSGNIGALLAIPATNAGLTLYLDD